ncbi:MAG: hypothetical protein BYD32DRAFT_414185 [Podila humilis]|nr:MAG: hypothetical protein BYD32DRAFT_414185 [Podila humilis]
MHTLYCGEVLWNKVSRWRREGLITARSRTMCKNHSTEHDRFDDGYEILKEHGKDGTSGKDCGGNNCRDCRTCSSTGSDDRAVGRGRRWGRASVRVGPLGRAGTGRGDVEAARVGVVGGQQQLQSIDTGLGVRGHGPDQVTDGFGAVNGAHLLDIEGVVDVVRIHEINLDGCGGRREELGGRDTGHGPGEGLVRASLVRDAVAYGLGERDVLERGGGTAGGSGGGGRSWRGGGSGAVD